MEEKLKNNRMVLALHQIAKDAGGNINPKLVGGAVVDIIENRAPKDYDIIDGNVSNFINALENCGYRFYTDSSTAITYFKHNIKVQLLKTKIEDFEFTVSQSSVNLVDLSMNLAEHEIKNKLLIPVNYFDEEKVFDALARIPHWLKKGYHIEEQTYYTLLKTVSKKVKVLIPREKEVCYGS